jgi:hypothetical protein
MTDGGKGLLSILNQLIVIGCSPVAIQFIVTTSPLLTVCRTGSNWSCGGEARIICKTVVSSICCIFSSLKNSWFGSVSCRLQIPKNHLHDEYTYHLIPS